MQSGKRAVCAGPGNPPVLVDDTACMKRAARAIIQGAAYDNNLLCIGEKEVFALDKIADKLMAEMENNGAVRLNSAQLERLTKAAFTFQGRARRRLPGTSLSTRISSEKTRPSSAKAAGVNVADKTQLLFAETDSEPSVCGRRTNDAVPAHRARQERGGRASRRPWRRSTITSTPRSFIRTTSNT
jgi:aldehyde dehydrogenase